jgi:uncharacterized protein (TIGR02453 family)
MLEKTTVQFLKALQKNNHKTWFDANRKSYEAARSNFAAFIDEVIALHGKKDSSIASLTAKECMFRINRDVRFSKNKDPYKTNFGASINQGGKKSVYAGYYFHLEPGNKSFVGGGLYVPEPAVVKSVRQEIDYNWDEFKAILRNKSFTKAYGDLSRWEGMVLSREPKGYEKDNPAIEYIRFKSWIASAEISDEQLMEKDLSKQVAQAFAALQPLLLFLNKAVDDAQ